MARLARVVVPGLPHQVTQRGNRREPAAIRRTAASGKEPPDRSRPYRDIGGSPTLADMLLIVGTVRLPPDRLEDARPVMARMISASRAEDGCEEYFYAEDVLERGLIHVKELWRDQAALDRHFASDHVAAWRSTWPDLGITDRHLSVYDVEQPRST